MHKLYSLDFLNKKVFGSDIFCGSKKVAQADESVTPEKILKLYFKQLTDTPRSDSKPVVTEQKEEDVYILNPGTKPRRKREDFDAEHSKEVAAYSEIMGRAMKLNNSEMEELNRAAYYHQIGETLLSEEELNEEDWQDKASKAAYEYLTEEKQFNINVARAVADIHKNYSADDYPLKRDFSFVFPYNHIISVADFYCHLSKVTDNENEKINILMKIGYNKFNIFVLHKFINLLRMKNE